MRKTLFFVGAAIMLAFLAWIIILRFFTSKISVQSIPAEIIIQESVSEEMVDTTPNPIADEIPDLNPAANSNPFGKTYKNPFE